MLGTTLRWITTTVCARVEYPIHLHTQQAYAYSVRKQKQQEERVQNIIINNTMNTYLWVTVVIEVLLWAVGDFGFEGH